MKDLRTITLEVLKETVFTRAELSEGTGYSKATISEWLNGKYPGDTAKLEARVKAYLQQFQAPALSYPDSRRLVTLLALLHESDNPESLLRAVGRFSPGIEPGEAR